MPRSTEGSGRPESDEVASSSWQLRSRVARPARVAPGLEADDRRLPAGGSFDARMLFTAMHLRRFALLAVVATWVAGNACASSDDVASERTPSREDPTNAVMNAFPADVGDVPAPRAGRGGHRRALGVEIADQQEPHPAHLADPGRDGGAEPTSPNQRDADRPAGLLARGQALQNARSVQVRDTHVTAIVRSREATATLPRACAAPR